ncbi:hypothetical protein FPRO03_12092 [Fusarium proliferatum]|nr:hypothetical protein FPRO03_12092 [Fusarium proliferatum]
MPSIDEAMARSLQGSAWEVVKDKFVRTIVADLSRRDMLADAAQTTDEVAQKSEDFATAFSSWDNSPQYGVTKPMRSEPPQYAEFETSKGRDDDALPEMPSWEGASSKKVEVHTEAVELDTLPSKPPHSQQSNMMGGVSPNNLTPYSQAQSNSSGYLGANQAPDVYSPIDQQGYGYQAPGMNPMYSSAAAVAPMPHERRSPALNTNGYSNQGYGHDQGFEQTQGYGQMQGYGQQGYGQATSPNDYAATYSGYRGTPPPRPASFAKRASMHQDEFGTYGQLPPRRSPAIPEDYGYGSPVRQSPGPQNDFGYAQPPRQSPAPMNDYRTPPPGPDTSYGAHPAQQRQHMPESHSPQEPYPGFKPYQP